MKIEREYWNSNMGFILASVGSAVGIGNIWRFPYLVGTNGGGAFLLPYVIILATFGLALMILEFAVGRYYQTSIIGSLAKIRKQFKWVGVFTVIVTFVVTSYYVVILGWILSYVFIMVIDPSLDFDSFSNSFYPVIAFFLVIAINFVIIRKGVSGGIEKLNKVGVILLICILVPLTIYAMFLPGSERGIDFYLSPDFSKIVDPPIWAAAFGQAFFSLSIGFGTLVAYGSYLRNKSSLIRSSSMVVAFDTVIAFVAGLIIFSFLFSFGMEPDQGASLVFKVMPAIFSQIEFGAAIAVLFFVLLLIAGITSSVSLFQVPISAIEDTIGMGRNKAVLIVTLLVTVVGVFSALSYSPIKLAVWDMPVFDFMDSVFGTYGITISAMMFVTIVSWFMDKKKLVEHIKLGSSIKVPYFLFYLARFVLPVAIAITTILSIVKF
jgi:NSS family neurotransmitter:Na+ symporter